jgi:hypothetical protein
MKNIVCAITGAGLSLSVLGSSLLVGLVGALGGILGKILVEFLINLFKKYSNNRKNSTNDALNRINDEANRHDDAIKRGIHCGITEPCTYRDSNNICHKASWDSNVCPNQVK